MKIKNKKDEFYIINQPKHAILSIIIVDELLPLPKETHDNLYKLSEVSDILFIFDNKKFHTSSINEKKFASLYESSSWVVSKEGLLKTLLNSYIYSKEILKNHVSYITANLSNLKEFDSTCIKNLQKVHESVTTYPIVNIRRKTSGEFYDLYKSSWSSWSASFDKESETNRFSSYTSDSKVTFLRSTTVTSIINYLKTEDGTYFMNTFNTDDFRNFISSLIKHISLNYIDSSVEHVKV